MIQLNNISVIFGKNTALESIALQKINLHMTSGDFIILIGSNGAGKSTLLQLLAGSMSPTHGNIYFDKINITHLSVEERAKWVAHVYQDPRLGTCEAFTIEENLAFAFNRGKKRGLKPALNHQMRKHFQSLLVDLDMGLENRLTDDVATLSGGQRQALSLMMATLQPSKILLLDEHTAALDPKTAKTVLSITQRIISQHRLTTVMVTHNMAHALEMGNRTLLMQQGKIIRDLSQEQRKQLTQAELIQFL